MPHHEENNFSAPAEVVDFSALLFDMDGTIIDSTPAIVKYWHETGKEIGVDGDGMYSREARNYFLKEQWLISLTSDSRNLARPTQHRCA